MAGGKSKRFNFGKIDFEYREKLLLPLGGKSIIDYIIDAALASKNIDRLIIATSPFTPHTKSIIKDKKKLVELIDTPGDGYHSDLSYIIKTLNLGITMTIAADIPLIKPQILDEIILKYFKLNKPALSVMANIKLFNKYGLKPTIVFDLDSNKKDLVPLGINIIDGRLIDEPELDEAIIISEWEELIYNINTIDDYFLLKKIFEYWY